MLALDSTTHPPLCVDLDGTLSRSDLLFESILLLVKRNPLYLLRLPLWLLKGKAALKDKIAASIEFNPTGQPYNQELLSWLKTEHLAGRSLWLCTATNERLAQSVAAQLEIFDGVIASDSLDNLAGESKAARLVERFGERGFDYCGTERRDLVIWRHARGAIVVGADAALMRDTGECAPIVRVFPGRANKLRAFVRALRPHQWSKNALILVPMLAAHLARDPHALSASLLAVVAFCLCASSVYVVNDLLDLEADRAHPRKCKRPFAAADLSIVMGLTIAPLLLITAAVVAAILPQKFQLELGIYYALTLAYSFALKRHVLIDTLALAGLYTMRIIAGAAAVSIPLSFWLLLFSVFLFLSLALVKRFAELDGLRRQQRLRTEGRGYLVEDLPLLQSLGTASGYLSVLVLALYINSPAIVTLYTRPKIVWMLCVLMLYWISRVWMKAQRGGMHDDPVVFALKDPVSLIAGMLAVITIVAAI